MPATIYTTIGGEMLDAICFDHYGNETPFVEAVLDVNREIARMGPVLPQGVDIVLPDLSHLTNTITIATLWDEDADVIQ